MPAKTEKSGLFGAWLPILLPAVFLTSLGLLILVSAGVGGDEGRDGADPTAGRVRGLPTEKCVSCVRRDVRDGDRAL